MDTLESGCSLQSLEKERSGLQEVVVVSEEERGDRVLRIEKLHHDTANNIRIQVEKHRIVPAEELLRTLTQFRRLLQAFRAEESGERDTVANTKDDIHRIPHYIKRLPPRERQGLEFSAALFHYGFEERQ